jgi:hypothetical protein
MALLPRPAYEQFHTLAPSESRAFFDAQVDCWPGTPGDEFLRAWDTGEFDAIADDPDRPEIMRLAMLIPLAR